MLALLLVLFGLVMDETDNALVFEISIETEVNVRGVGITYNMPDDADLHWKAGCVMIARRTRTTKEGLVVDRVELLPLSLDHSAELRAIPHTVIRDGAHKESEESLALNIRAVVAGMMFTNGLRSHNQDTEVVVFDMLNVGKYGWNADVMVFDVK
jgi:hypothetical protein